MFLHSYIRATNADAGCGVIGRAIRGRCAHAEKLFHALCLRRDADAEGVDRIIWGQPRAVGEAQVRADYSL